MVLINSRAEALFGYTRQELLGQPVEMLIPESLSARHEAVREAFIASPHDRRMGQVPDLRASRKDATEFPAEISLSPIETEDGLLVAASVRDLTRQFTLQSAVDTNLLIQSAIGRILQTSLEPLSLEDVSADARSTRSCRSPGSPSRPWAASSTLSRPTTNRD